MGWFDGRSSSYDGRSHSHAHDGRSHSHQQHHSTTAHRSSTSKSTRGLSPSRSSYSSSHHRPSYARSSSSFFGGFGSSRGFGSGGSSYYRRSPRQGYISYLVHKLQRMVKELWYYARRNPVKAFFAVIVPLLSAGGAIHGLMRQFGVRLPFVDGRSRRMGGGYYGSSGYGFGDRGGGGLMNNMGGLMSMARAFM